MVIAPAYDEQDTNRFAAIVGLAHQLGLPLLASARPILHHASRRRIADVLTAIRSGKTVKQLGRSGPR